LNALGFADMSDADPREPRGAGAPAAELAAEAPIGDAAALARPRIAISEALRNNWIEIWYQPKIDLRRKCLAGAEALARIRHPQFGVLPPGGFQPEVDDEGIAELTQQALLATLCDWTMFEEAGFNLQLAINVPVRALFTLPIPRLVAEYRPKSERWPGLIVEVTEDQIVREAAAVAQHVAAQFRAAGILIAIDEFGAGFSSFAGLRDLPFAELKIDRRFVEHCATEAADAAICQTAIDLAHRFGAAAVAEGVENAADLQALIVMGCDFGQGAAIAPPMPKERFVELLRQRMSKPRAAAARPSALGSQKHAGRVA
jgi:EAL domain-containing protein (putative c-di-GMP-specific phosphodiesterase class I)